eukprot:NODE_697_length_1253_cov_95.359680_g658_i0.p1 GENE.NODE_697_length_1253_cov_95.359680_g658_i0~~NODE_697_length_1253_cov_95.359680_g658_i0.p1  ORF type:complete len:221 (-),score=22.30 NODE_697_length_1253_cov_95.359680_g658_i0:470-1132(-)
MLSPSQSPLHNAAAHGDAEELDLLLSGQYKDRINDQDSSGRTPLYHAVSNLHVNAVFLLLDNNADIAPKTRAGDSVLSLATDLAEDSQPGAQKILELLKGHAKTKREAAQRKQAAQVRQRKLKQHAMDLDTDNVEAESPRDRAAAAADAKPKPKPKMQPMPIRKATPNTGASLAAPQTSNNPWEFNCKLLILVLVTCLNGFWLYHILTTYWEWAWSGNTD